LVEVEKLNPKEAITSLLDEYYSLTK
jgi:hypothetical protein